MSEPMSNDRIKSIIPRKPAMMKYRHDNYQRGAHDVSTARPCDFLCLRMDVLQESGHPLQHIHAWHMAHQ